MGFTDSLPLAIKVFKEGTSKSVPYVAYSPELDLSVAGKDSASAKKALLDVVEDVLAHKIADGTTKNNIRSANISNEEYFKLL